MYKIITFAKPKGFYRCLEWLMRDDALLSKTKQYSQVGSLLIPEEDLETLYAKLSKKEKKRLDVSDEVTVRVHDTVLTQEAEVVVSADQVPWGVRRIGAPDYWDRTKGNGIRVAVIDTGISRLHPDLKGQVKGRITVTNNGKGYETIDGHGTHVAGTIAALANKRGVVGVAPQVELYDVRAFGPDGTANMSDIIEGINWAIEKRVHVINMSFGTPQPHSGLENAIRRAYRAGIVLVASAGNNGGTLEYPAAYNGVIAVGAIDSSGRVADFSARGADTLAPGVSIKSTWLKKSYRTLDGTSMAAAHVSGLYALRIGARRR
ncbi:S8 family peptidase [Brevibacillus dissolubilis]|uniref:S8 family peptidase n=1 Tax=Brevibacillus dissolubilis TaxID=1844116 RepID=UPI002100302F|nr:S8 family peptidase [Brevibacillus dissolubilis]